MPRTRAAGTATRVCHRLRQSQKMSLGCPRRTNQSWRTTAASSHDPLFLSIFLAMGHFAPEQSCLVKMWFSLSSAQPPLHQRSSTFSTPSRAGAVPTLERCCLTGTRERINVFKLVIMYRVRTVKQITASALAVVPKSAVTRHIVFDNRVSASWISPSKNLCYAAVSTCPLHPHLFARSLVQDLAL